MAHSSECTGQCALKVLDTADIVREAMLRQLFVWPGFAPWLLAVTAPHINL